MQAHANFNAVDIVVTLVLIIGAVDGLRKGLSGKLAGLGAFAIALAAGGVLYAPVTAALGGRCAGAAGVPGWSAAGFLVTVLASLLVSMFAHMALRRLLSAVLPAGLDRLGGMAVGLAIAAVASAVTLTLLSMSPAPALRRACGEESFFGGALRRNVPFLRDTQDGGRPPDPPVEDAQRERV